MKTKDIAGIRVNYDLTYESVLNSIKEYTTSDSPKYIWTVNPEFIMKARTDPAFKNILNMSSISTPDGIGVVFATKYLDEVSKLDKNYLYPLKTLFLGLKIGLHSFLNPKYFENRITGSDLLLRIAEFSEKNGLSLFLLGGWEKDFFGRMKENHGNIAKRTADKLKCVYPSLRIIGATSDFDYQESYDASALEYIHQCMINNKTTSIDILFVGYGSKKQEEWIVRNISKIPAKVGIGVGASFDFVIGTHKRAPQLLKKYNIEWFYRLLTQPWRLKRILISFPAFPLFVYYLVLKDYFKH